MGLTQLSAIILKSSPEGGKKLLDVISSTIYKVLTIIKDSAKVEDTLERALDIFSDDNRSSPLSASRQAISDNLIKDTKKSLDKKLREDYISSMNELDGFHGKSKEVILAIDGTPEKTTSRYKNNQYSPINIGQKKKWETGFNYSAIYDATNQLFVSVLHQDYHHSKHKTDKLKDFILQLQDSCKTVEEAGAVVKFIVADRGYYDAELFAAAYFNQISLKCVHNDNTRVIIPKKFTREKENKKIAYLENPNSKDVFIDHIGLSKYSHSSLISRCKTCGMKESYMFYLIPMITVAVVDGYKTNKCRTVEELRIEWMHNKNNIKNTENRIVALSTEYINLQKLAGKKKLHRLTGIKGRKRTTFMNSAIKQKYNEIYKTYRYLKRLKKACTQMLNTLMFFCISTRPNETLSGRECYFINLASLYHERWGIENGFKEDKSKFIQSSRSRKSTRRQWNLIMGAMLYNHWHVARLRLMLIKERKKYWNKVSWDPHHPFVRRKLERKHGVLLSAESYLLQFLGFGLNLRIRKLLSN